MQEAQRQFQQEQQSQTQAQPQANAKPWYLQRSPRQSALPARDVCFRRIGGYWMSNDFERFYSLVRARVLVICASETEQFKIRTISTRAFGQQKWKLKSMFDRCQYWFVDPELVANGDEEMIRVKVDDRRVTGDVVNPLSLPVGRGMGAVASAFREYAERYQCTADIYARRGSHNPGAGELSASYPTTATTNVNHRGGVMGEADDADLGIDVTTANLHDWLANMGAIDY